jgi:hypothetical protein
VRVGLLCLYTSLMRTYCERTVPPLVDLKQLDALLSNDFEFAVESQPLALWLDQRSH